MCCEIIPVLLFGAISIQSSLHVSNERLSSTSFWHYPTLASDVGTLKLSESAKAVVNLMTT